MENRQTILDPALRLLGLAEPLASDKDRASLPVALVVTAFAGYWTLFFVMGLSKVSLGALLVSVWFIGLFYLIIRSGKPAVYRRVFFVSIALFFFPSFIANLVAARGSMALSAQDIFANETPYCHIVSTMTVLPWALTRTVIFPGRLTGSYASIYSMLAIWLVASLTLGRGWCAWVCFYGGWDDLFSRARKRALISLEGKEASVRRFSYAMLAFVALASLASLSAVYCVWLCPFKLVTEYPAITGFTGYLATMIFILAFFGLVVVMPALTRKRFQCAAYCPFGALQGLIDGISPFRIRIDTAACIGCGACARVCPVLAIDKALIEAKKAVPHLNCVKCGECVAACPRGAIRLAFRIASAPLVAPAAAITAKADKAPSTSARERRMGAMLAEIVQPRILFATTAFVFGMVISSSFAVRSVGMVIVAVAGLFTGGR